MELLAGAWGASGLAAPDGMSPPWRGLGCCCFDHTTGCAPVATGFRPHAGAWVLSLQHSSGSRMPTRGGLAALWTERTHGQRSVVLHRGSWSRITAPSMPSIVHAVHAPQASPCRPWPRSPSGQKTGNARRRGRLPESGTPDAIRTRDLRLRRPLLYPAELPGHDLKLSSGGLGMQGEVRAYAPRRCRTGRTSSGWGGGRGREWCPRGRHGPGGRLRALRRRA